MTHHENIRRIIIIGAGPGGLCMAIKLLEAGIRDFVILEEAPGLGGTWYHNRYPGLCCAVTSPPIFTPSRLRPSVTGRDRILRSRRSWPTLRTWPRSTKSCRTFASIPRELSRFANDPDAALTEREKIFNDIDPHITFASRELCEFCEAAGREHLLVVEDAEVRKKLTPRVPWGTQRPLFSQTWFPMFNRSNVELIVDPIERIIDDSIVSVDGEVRRVDIIIAATGFQATRFLSTIDVTGRGGLRLQDAWADGAEAYLGITTHGFPNIFMLYGPNTNTGSVITLLEFQVEYVIRQLARMEAQGLKWMEVNEDVMQHYNEQLQRDLDAVEVWQAECHNYYRAGSGRIVTQWPHTMAEYGRRTRLADSGAYAIG